MTNQMKPRSHVVTDGLERAAARGMLRAVTTSGYLLINIRLSP